MRLFYIGYFIPSFFSKVDFFQRMGKCTVSSALLEGFSWAKAENEDQVRCELDNCLFRISHGRFDLKQHEETQLHKKAVTARAATPDIRTATSSQTDCQQFRALIIHVLDIVVSGQASLSLPVIRYLVLAGSTNKCFLIRATLILNVERRKQPMWQFTEKPHTLVLF